MPAPNGRRLPPPWHASPTPTPRPPPPREHPEPPPQQCPGIQLHLTDSSANVKMRLDRSPCWYRAQRFNAALKKLGSAQSLSITENPGISLTAGDPPAVGPLEQWYQVLAR